MSLRSAADVWLAAELDDLQSRPPLPGPPNSIVFGCPLWGEKFIDRFLGYCLRSILEPANRRALRGSRLVIFTDHAGLWALRNLPLILAPHGIVCVLREIPATVVTDPYAVFPILAAAQAAMLRMAALSSMGFSMMMPDIVYSAGFFERLLSIGRSQRAIIHFNMWADEETVLPVFDRWRNAEGELPVPHEALGDIGWEHLHPEMKPCLMNDVKDIEEKMPASHMLAWRSSHAMHFRCPHLNPLYLSPEICRTAEVTSTLDACLPDLIPDHADVYAPSPADGLTLLEFAKVKPRVERGPFRDFARVWWDKADHRHLRFFTLDCRVGVSAAQGMDPAEIDAAHSRIVEKLVMAVA